MCCVPDVRQRDQFVRQPHGERFLALDTPGCEQHQRRFLLAQQPGQGRAQCKARMERQPGEVRDETGFRRGDTKIRGYRQAETGTDSCALNCRDNRLFRFVDTQGLIVEFAYWIVARSADAATAFVIGEVCAGAKGLAFGGEHDGPAFRPGIQCQKRFPDFP